MNRHVLLSSAIALALIGGTGLLLSQVRGHQALAPPGVRTHPLPGSTRLQADLPPKVLDYDSELRETESLTVNSLPNDTSFGWRRYTAADGFALDLRVVLMGHDRTSIHKPQICLKGQGWHIDETASEETRVRVQQPYQYDLPVVKLVAHNTTSIEGRVLNGIYVYWYVADDAVSASTLGIQRMYLMTEKLLRTGILQRWAYVSCFAPCAQGQEAATFDRMKTFIAASAPEFQLYPRPKPISLSSVP
jgi:hypothetical protein